ncbi:MAG: hypothetical protein U5K74_08355 [Gemmatimonadaceae bacterium]|nr:hypothetical protein [Gemmatimonadaceae bacterium]
MPKNDAQDMQQKKIRTERATLCVQRDRAHRVSESIGRSSTRLNGSGNATGDDARTAPERGVSCDEMHNLRGFSFC